MKRPTYYINDLIKDGEIEFPAWTLIQPIFNEDFIPEHQKEVLKEARRLNYHQDDYVMCIIGKFWLAVPKSRITERY